MSAEQDRYDRDQQGGAGGEGKREKRQGGGCYRCWQKIGQKVSAPAPLSTPLTQHLLQDLCSAPTGGLGHQSGRPSRQTHAVFFFFSFIYFHSKN
jgi:hypothetical protein